MLDFEFKPFDEMTPEDYAKVGFKSGLEVHQQLLTEKKLFCRCPAGKYSHDYDAEILRHMRPTLSELGEYDGTALMEFKTKKNIIYRIHHDSVCTYEMDDTPPFEINDDALDIAIEIALLIDATVVDEIHIARKQYLDGSIPTGFQRTAITCVGGKIPYKDRSINLIQMSIEEDSCREISDIGHMRVYIADRLGMPLIETVTHPEMKTPQEVAEVNDILRRIARSTGKVRTGIGTGREDVNVSVDGGTRVEIKGVSKIKSIPLLTYNEAMRQWNLLRLREELKSRGIDEDSFSAEYHDVTKLLRKTRFQPINDAIAEGKIVNCVKLSGYRNLLNWQTQTDTYFSKEISDRVRVVACLTTLPNIIHSDSPSETVSSSSWSKVKKFVNAGDNDTIVLVWGDETDAETGANEVIIRAREAANGIPPETRQALSDGTNGFERILPGPERMYPDTDLPPKVLNVERIAKINSQLPKKIWDRENWYRELQLPEDIVIGLAYSDKAELFEKLVKILKVPAMLAGVALMNYPKRIKKAGLNIYALDAVVYEKVFNAYLEGRLAKDGIYYALKNIAKDGKFSMAAIPVKCTDDELERTIEEARIEVKLTEIIKPEKTEMVLFGIIMNNLRGRASGIDVKKYLNENNSEEV